MAVAAVCGNDISRCAGVHACVCVGKFRQAEALLESLKAAAGAAGRPMVSAYNLLLKGHVAADNLDAARRAFGAMSARGLSPDAVTFNTLISGFVRRGDVASAQSLLRRMRGEGVQPDAWTYTTLALGYGRQGQMAEMRGVVQEMQQAGVTPNSVGVLSCLDLYTCVVSIRVAGMWGSVCAAVCHGWGGLGRGEGSVHHLHVFTLCVGSCAVSCCVCRRCTLQRSTPLPAQGSCRRLGSCCSSCCTTSQMCMPRWAAVAAAAAATLVMATVGAGQQQPQQAVSRFQHSRRNSESLKQQQGQHTILCPTRKQQHQNSNRQHIPCQHHMQHR